MLNGTITYVEMESTDAAFHFCVEEFALRHLSPPVLLLWQTDPCVMLGSNQIAHAEADMAYITREGIQIVRRASGGGTIFTDNGTLLYTLITAQENAEKTRTNVAKFIISALREMGVPARLEGRNDICASGKKFSGMAQYARNGKICTHGSILFNADLEKLARVLQVNADKFQGKAVRSVRSRVTNIISYVGEMKLHEFKPLLKQKLLHNHTVATHDFSKKDMNEIHEIYAEKFNNPAWTFGRTPKFTFRNRKRFAGGALEIFLDIVQGKVTHCAIRGDFLSIAPINKLEETFIGLDYEYDTFKNALKPINLHHYLGSINEEMFLLCAFDVHEAKPEWLRVRDFSNTHQTETEEILRRLQVNTVCHAANCPNRGECFSQLTATFMLMGTVCTRNCRFCNVSHGAPAVLDANEPQNIANAVRELQLKYAVITSVTRDDLPDGGASHFAQTIHAIREISPKTAVEVLIPDFAGNENALKTIINAQPHVINHNMETVASLYPTVRPQAVYERSLQLLQNVKNFNPHIRTKSGFMLGLGETDKEVTALLEDLRAANCDFLTIGQYLPPGKNHIDVQTYVTPAQFDTWGKIARAMGFAAVTSAPLVRSSYRAGKHHVAAAHE